MAKDTTFENYAQDAQKTFTEQTAQMAGRMEELADFAKGNMDAMIVASMKATESMKDIATEMLTYAQSTMDSNVAAIKEMGQMKDPSAFVEKQSALAKASMESFAKQAQKLNEMTMAAAKDCSEPVNARLAAVGEIVKGNAFKG